MLELVYTLLLSYNVIQSPPVTLKAANYKYGPLVEYQLRNQSRILIKLNLSQFIPGKADNVYVNRDIVLPLLFVMLTLKEKGLLDEINYFAGCYNPRPVRGTKRPSAHAFGLACDFPLLNIGQNRYSEQFIKTWEDFGFCSGHRFGDNMHFSYSGWECDISSVKAGRKVVLPGFHPGE